MSQLNPRPLHVDEFFWGQGGYGTALKYIDPRIIDSTYWLIKTNSIQSPNEYHLPSVDTDLNYNQLDCERLAQIPTYSAPPTPDTRNRQLNQPLVFSARRLHIPCVYFTLCMVQPDVPSVRGLQELG